MTVKFSQYSRVYKRITRRYEQELLQLEQGLPSLVSMQVCYDKLTAHSYPNCGDALRVLRQLVLHRLIELDCDSQISVQYVTKAMTELAEFTLNVAYKDANEILIKKYGIPKNQQNQTCPLWIVGMGKLGARELNVSSDIDLIYVYQEDGNTDGKASISNKEFFSHIVKAINKLIDAVTEHGFVFRVDIALRPNGSVGPVAISLATLADYFQKHGREWERFAWLKSRVVAPQQFILDDSCNLLQKVVLPFVYRKYLDFNMLESMRDLHQKIRQQKNIQASQRQQQANDVKLSRGGIREIEFSVQLFQVIRGGTYPELRTRATLQALKILEQLDLINADNAKILAQAYIFYRDVEHRIQYLDDQQTHLLPTQQEDLLWIVQSMNFSTIEEFMRQLQHYQHFVISYSDGLLEQNNNEVTEVVEVDLVQANTNPQQIKDFEYPPPQQAQQQLPPQLQQQIKLWLTGVRVFNQPEEIKRILNELLKRSIYAVNQQYVEEKALQRMIFWLDAILRKTTYLTMLYERPKVHRRLLKLLDNAHWTLIYLKQHPRVIDELSRDEFFSQRFVAEKFIKLVEQRKIALTESNESSEENLLDLLRVAHKTEVFKTLARDLEGYLTVEQVADDLSLLADTILKIVVKWSWQFVRRRHQQQPNLAIVAYGKLGGKELGYGSDLDVVFLYDDQQDTQEIYIAFVRKIISWLTSKTGEGDLFEIDTALRPNGNSGLLATSFSSFANYQIKRGANVAWVWEHQAITRARFVVGTIDLEQQFDNIRCHVLQTPRNEKTLKQEILAMREKMFLAHKNKSNQFNLKHGRGGMIDVEFITQFLVLLYSAQYPQLMANLGTIALLQIAEQLEILDKEVGSEAAKAYRWYRKQQHLARLDDLSLNLDSTIALEARTAVAKLWQDVFAEQRLIAD